MTAVGSAACSKSDVVSEATPTTEPSAALKVQLREFKVQLASTSLTPGHRTLEIDNVGKAQHELLVFRSDLDPSRYPLDNGDINEEGPGISLISDGENIDPGKHQARVVDLTAPGKYLFVCNIPGHFKAGMFVSVTVALGTTAPDASRTVPTMEPVSNCA